MEVIQWVLLAIIQGVTEFLPISSSAHLILPSEILGWPDQGLAFDVAVHVGSLLAVVIYFRKDLLVMSKAWSKSLAGNHDHDSNLAWLIIAATVPAGLCGLLFDDFIEARLRSTLVIAATTLLFGGLLAIADKKHGLRHEISFRDAMLVGVAQTFALVPGTSRSGVTMTAALFLGYSREFAARFSFLLSIPLIVAAGLFKTKELVEQPGAVDWFALTGGTLVSAISAYLCIYLFLRWIEKLGFMPFVIYRFILGTVLLAIYYF